MEFIVEIVIGAFSIFLSIWFYWLAKKSEKISEETLKKIDAQVENIKEINSRWLDKSIDYFTETKTVNPLEQLPQLSKFVTEIIEVAGKKKRETPYQNVDIEIAIRNDIFAFFYIYQCNRYVQFFLISFRDDNSKEIKNARMEAIDILNVSAKNYETFRSVLTLFDVVKKNDLYLVFEIVSKNHKIVRNYEQFEKLGN